MTIALLGVYHGVNPAMGWLSAAAMGFQGNSGRAVLRALPPIALGHAASVLTVLASLRALQALFDFRSLRFPSSAAAIAFGIYRAFRPHFRIGNVGMRPHTWSPVLWSFLVSSGHGAGLMLLPLYHSLCTSLGSTFVVPLQASAIHASAMLSAMALTAILVYFFLGLQFLRKVWVNVDFLWSIALVTAGLAGLLM